MSDTPRTEMELCDWSEFTDEGYGPTNYVKADFARDLEREAAAFRVVVQALYDNESMAIETHPQHILWCAARHVLRTYPKQ